MGTEDERERERSPRGPSPLQRKKKRRRGRTRVFTVSYSLLLCFLWRHHWIWQPASVLSSSYEHIFHICMCVTNPLLYVIVVACVTNSALMPHSSLQLLFVAHAKEWMGRDNWFLQIFRKGQASSVVCIWAWANVENKERDLAWLLPQVVPVFS